MQRGCVQTGAGCGFAVAAFVVRIAGMQGLVHIAHQVQQELQRQPLLLLRRARIPQLGGEFADLVHDTVAGRTARSRRARGHRRLPEARRDQVRRVELEVDVMPVARPVVVHRAAGVAIGIAEFVGPCRLDGDVGPRRELGFIAREQHVDARADQRLEIAIGDSPHDLVTFIAPGQGANTDERQT